MAKSAFTKSKGFEDWNPGVWAMLIQPKPVREGVEVKTHPAALEYCLRTGVIGLGWDIGQPGKDFETTDSYYDDAKKAHGQDKLASPETFERIKPGDLVWFASKTTESLEGAGKFTGIHLYLALVVGPWEYRHTPLGWFVDIVSVVPSLIKYVGEKSGSKISFASDLQLSEENAESVTGSINQLWNRYLIKPKTVKPVYKLGDEFASISKELWSILVKGANPGFCETPVLPPFSK